MLEQARNQAEPESDREIIMARVFDAPRELVFEAWTDPKHLPQWWGPRGFSVTTHAIDVRVGGVWRFQMLGPDGTLWPNRIRYTELSKPFRITYVHDSDADDDPRAFHVTITFDDVGGTTKVTMRSLFATSEQRRFVVGFGAVELGQQTLEKLAEHLGRMRS